jgi:putative SOS response-associated peptidase YedK
MCGRFTFNLPPELLVEIFGLAEIPTVPAPRYNTAPTQQILAVRQDAVYSNRLDQLRWGFIPSWTREPQHSPLLNNARSETVAEKPSFRSAIKYRRCLIPSSGFYEWLREGTSKTPYYIHLRDKSPMVYAGIWESWKSPEGEVVESCSMLTTEANSLIATIHERMPVILHPSEYPFWLDRDMTDPQKLIQLYKPYPADLIEMHQVSPLVNDARNNGPDLIRTVPDTT